MKKKIIAISLVASLAVMAIAGATLAYFTSEDSAKNVMTMGSLEIVQNEQQRVINEDGTFGTELEDFENNKLMIPAVYAGKVVNGLASPETGYDGTVNVNGKDYKIFGEGVQNVVDKIVTVTNEGTIPAYVRTLFAFEDTGDMSAKVHYMFHDANGKGELIYFPSNGNDYLQFTTEDGTVYTVGYYVYDAAIEAGATSEPSLMQVFFDKSATNEDIAKAQGTYEILVLSQAVQAQGFADADTALNDAFGEITYDADDLVADWFADIE